MSWFQACRSSRWRRVDCVEEKGEKKKKKWKAKEKKKKKGRKRERENQHSMKQKRDIRQIKTDNVLQTHGVWGWDPDRKSMCTMSVVPNNFCEKGGFKRKWEERSSSKQDYMTHTHTHNAHTHTTHTHTHTTHTHTHTLSTDFYSITCTHTYTHTHTNTHKHNMHIHRDLFC